MKGTAAQAEQSAVQATAAAAAYAAAFAATVPPPVVAANRSLLMTLIASNILGQNTPAIAATEADYGEMWAQDAAAMYGYAGASASAARLTPYTPPPPTTNTAGLGAHGAAVATAAGAQAQSTLAQLATLVPQTLQGLALSGSSAAQAEPPILSLLDALAGPLSPISLFGIGGIPYLLAIQCVLLPMNGSNVVAAVVRAEKMAGEGTWTPPALAGLDGGPRLVSSPTVSAGMAKAASVGRLSVPAGWAAAVPEADAVPALSGAGVASGVAAEVVPESQSGLMSSMALGGLAGRAVGATGGAASRAVGAASGKVTGKAKPTKATIIVIPPSAED